MIHRRSADLLYNTVLSEKDSPAARMVICLNDHPGLNGSPPDYDGRLYAFLDTYFPTPSSFEDISPLHVEGLLANGSRPGAHQGGDAPIGSGDRQWQDRDMRIWGVRPRVLRATSG
jgi:hypothetical protein